MTGFRTKRFRDYVPEDAGMNERYLIETTDDGWDIVSKWAGSGEWQYLFEVGAMKAVAELQIEVWRKKGGIV